MTNAQLSKAAELYPFNTHGKPRERSSTGRCLKSFSQDTTTLFPISGCPNGRIPRIPPPESSLTTSESIELTIFAG